MPFCLNASKVNFRFPLLVSLFIVSAAPLSVPAATVTLNNGDRLTGELVQLEDNVLRFRSGMFGEIQIPWEHVQALISDEGVRIHLQDGTALEGKLALEPGDTIAIKPESGTPPRKVERQDLAALNPPVADTSTKYSGKLDVGGAFNRGNSSDDQFNIMGEFTARAPANRYSLGLVINEGRSFGITTTSNQRVVTQYDAFLNDRDFLFGSARAERDELAALDLRASLGAGYGRQFIDRDTRKLSGQVGVNYVRENYTISPDQSFPSLSIGLKYDQEFFERRLAYFQYMDMDTSLNDARDTLLRTRLGVRVPLTKGINISTQLNHDYTNRPATGKKKADTALIFSVGYGF